MGKTTYSRRTNMSPFVQLILVKLIDFIAKNAEKYILELKDKFLKTEDPEIAQAIQEVGFEPSEDNLNKLNAILVAKGYGQDELATTLINSAQV